MQLVEEELGHSQGVLLRCSCFPTTLSSLKAHLDRGMNHRGSRISLRNIVVPLGGQRGARQRRIGSGSDERPWGFCYI